MDITAAGNHPRRDVLPAFNCPPGMWIPRQNLRKTDRLVWRPLSAHGRRRSRRRPPGSRLVTRSGRINHDLRIR